MVSNEKGEKQNNKKSFLSVQLMTFSMELGNKKKVQTSANSSRGIQLWMMLSDVYGVGGESFFVIESFSA